MESLSFVVRKPRAEPFEPLERLEADLSKAGTPEAEP
jgi:hypothetical protein